MTLRRFVPHWPLRLFEHFESLLDHGGLRALGAVLLGLVAGWWLYVPVHELLHVAGCVSTGGTVDRLEVDPAYGGALLERVFPFVVAGGDYAGRLSGFDTGGSDVVYLVTVLAPWLVSLGPGPLLAVAAARRRWSLLWGASLPWALGPVLGVTGDALETGGILVSRIPPWTSETAAGRLRSDDLFRSLEQAGTWSGTEWAGLALAQMLGVVLAVLAVTVGFRLADRFAGAPPDAATLGDTED